MTDHTYLIKRLRDFAEEPHANRCPADMACTCGHDVSRVALAHEAATAIESFTQENAALREALTRVTDWMDDDRIGQITYMEGSNFYGDLHQHKCVARAVLARFPAPPDGGEGG